MIMAKGKSLFKGKGCACKLGQLDCGGSLRG